MKSPNVYTLARLSKTINSGCSSSDGSGAWVPARPEGYSSLRLRFKIAMLVFTGQADALVWPQGQ